jgi:hypothetical protein
MCPVLSSQKFIDLINQGLYALDQSKIGVGKNFFQALAWQGLEESNGYKMTSINI